MPTDIDMGALDRAHEICMKHAPYQQWAIFVLYGILDGKTALEALEQHNENENDPLCGSEDPPRTIVEFWDDAGYCVDIVNQRTANYKHGREEYDAIKAAYDFAEQKDKG